MIKEQVLNACRHFMVPIVRILLRSGVTWKEFSDLSKELYVATARSDYGIQGRSTNLSRVSLITGLSRREVARIRNVLAGRDERRPAPRSRISEVLTGWFNDPEFLDSAGNPAELARDGGSGSLAALLKRYAGDMPHGALLKELLQLRLVEQVSSGDYRVLSRHYTRTSLDPDLVRQMGVALHDHAAILAHNVNRERRSGPRFERMATNSRIAHRYAGGFAELVEKHGEAFLEHIDDWLSQHEIEGADADLPGVRLGVGMYMIEDDAPTHR